MLNRLTIILAAVAALCIPSTALAQDAAPIDPATVVALLSAHSWAALAAVVIPLLLHLAQRGVYPLGLVVPAAVQPALVTVLSIAAGVADAVAGGTPWRPALAGGVAAALVALRLSPAAPAPADGQPQANPAGAAPEAPREAPTVPPVVSGLLLALGGLVLAGALTGCTGPLDAAVRAANGARAIGDAARTAITAACVPAYRAANTAAALAAVDAKCLPAERAYVDLAVAHAGAVVALQRAQLGQATEAEAAAAAQAVGQSAAVLATAVRGVAP